MQLNHRDGDEAESNYRVALKEKQYFSIVLVFVNGEVKQSPPEDER